MDWRNVSASASAIHAASSPPRSTAPSPRSAANAAATVFAGNALSVTLPGGALASLAYTTRRLRALGASASLTAVSLAVTGLLSAVTLGMLGVAGLLPAGLAMPFMRLEPFGLLLVVGAVLVLPRVADGFDPVGWALRTVVADGFDFVLMLSFHGGGRA